ncbi:MAG: zeta toxin family protein [Chloroflexota bacterium]|nr:zeta toxin family protein [Chloroflexota bacterium]
MISKRPLRIILTGFSGSGKTEVARLVAERLAEAMLEKFGGDHIDETKRSYQGYLNTIGPRGKE